MDLMAEMLERRRGGEIARGLNILLGVWLFISAFLWMHAPAQRTNSWIVAVLAVIFAAVALSMPPARWLNTALSIWLFISCWALPHQNVGTQWNNALVAIAMFVISLVPSQGEGVGVAHRVPA